MFTDRVILDLFAGKGGNGTVAWRREKYLPKGGPYGGDGGKGGSLVFEADDQLSSLEAYRNRRILKAENGGQGGANNRKGRNGRDLIIKIPRGTLVKDAETGEVLYDFTEDKARWVVCKGGRGGWGNTHFKSPTNRAPNFATPGKSGEQLKVELELKLIADVGLVGFPNAGKSTFISRVSAVPVKIAAYPFTTLRPNLGYVIQGDGSSLLIADIPGIIEGAHRNKGLGFEFLRHIERTRVLLFVLDASGFEGRDPLEDFATLRNEVTKYNPQLAEKPFAVALNKIDTGFVGQTFRQEHPDLPIFEISALTGQGVEEIIGFLNRKLSI
ncbi:MAG: GTPase ObgE [Chlamydiales bacterium]|nr:GTPase ObgE [Chlamydiales bacterium]